MTLRLRRSRPTSAEEYIGRAISGRRNEAVIATKGSIRRNANGFWSDASREHLLAAAEASLRLDVSARERDHSLLELAFGWLLAKPLVGSVIAGATSVAQVQANAAAASWAMTADDLAAVDAAFEGADAPH